MHENTDVGTVLRFGPFMLDPRSGELRKGDTRLKVPDQSIAVLHALLQRPGDLVTREELRDRLWARDTFVDFDAGLNAAVRRLRDALNDSAEAPRYVETLPRRGYRFIAPLEGVPSAPETPIVSETVRSRRIRVRRVVLAAVALAIVMWALWVGLSRHHVAPALARPLPITRFPGLELDPALSPSGTFVAFAWEGDGGDNFDIYVRSIDGSSQLRLTRDAAADHAPAWSPDGQRIAFVRVLDGKREIVVVPALGGPEQRLFEAGPENIPWRVGGWWSYGLSWTPDGKYLVFGDRSDSSSTLGIYLYSLENGERQRLTSPPANLSDIQPVVSPDGRYLAFVRLVPWSFGGNVFLQKLDRLKTVGEPVQLTSGTPVQSFDWMPDSRGIIHDGGPVEPGLRRVAVAGGASELLFPNVKAARPSLDRSGSAVAYQTGFLDSNIWELPTPSSPSTQSSGNATFRLIASTVSDLSMQFSPDAARIVFGSDRSGRRALWVSNRDGSQAKQVTSIDGGFVGSPSWSADGNWIAFDGVRLGGSWNIYVVAADGSPGIRTVTSDAFNNIRPNWSLDGRWIYFGSNRTGDWQIWKVPSAGGTPVQVTRGGGKEPIVSPDGRYIYYAKSAPLQGIWSIPAEGGPEARVVERGRELSFDVAETGIFVMDTSAKPQATVEMFSFASRQLMLVARLPAGLRFAPASYLTVTRDGRSMLYVQYDQWTSDIEMLRELR
jgi:Tol biopolymer transport system component/DNA-binding winged helix-turn-helix (wHTH) protein